MGWLVDFDSCIEIKGAVDPTPLGVPITGDGVQGYSEGGGNSFSDGQLLSIEFSDENSTLCQSDWRANVNFQEGDMIFIDWWIALMSNPGQDRSLPEIAPAFSGSFTGTSKLPRTSSASQCIPPLPYEFYNPGPVVVDSDVTLTADSCAVDVKNTYTMSDDVPDV